MPTTPTPRYFSGLIALVMALVMAISAAVSAQAAGSAQATASHSVASSRLSPCKIYYKGTSARPTQLQLVCADGKVTRVDVRKWKPGQPYDSIAAGATTIVYGGMLTRRKDGTIRAELWYELVDMANGESIHRAVRVLRHPASSTTRY